MLGSFLEIGFGTHDIAATYRELQALGFAAVTAGDMRGDGYAVVCDGDIYIGLYASEQEDTTLTFVRPELERYVRTLRRRDVEIAFASLGDQEFHELGFYDPDGQRVTLVEARTFSPIVADQRASSACGRFFEYSIGVRSLEVSRAFWLGLGFNTVAEGEAPYAWCRLATTGLALGLHETAALQAGPCYAATQFDARLEFLRAKGFSVERRAHHYASSERCATIPIGASTRLYMIPEPRDSE